MGSIKRIYYLAKKDLILELRNIYSLGGILLYLISSVFIVYKVINNAEPVVWNAIFWILFLFVAVSAMIKSFVQESGNSAIFYYSLFDPYEVLVAKLGYNLVLMFFLACILLLTLQIFLPTPISDPGLLILCIFLASLGVAVVFSFISAISNQASQNTTLLSIMAFPIVLPILLTALKISAQALGIISDTAIASDILILLSINLIMFGLSLLLFPFLWKA